MKNVLQVYSQHSYLWHLRHVTPRKVLHFYPADNGLLACRPSINTPRRTLWPSSAACLSLLCEYRRHHLEQRRADVSRIRFCSHNAGQMLAQTELDFRMLCAAENQRNGCRPAGAGDHPLRRTADKIRLDEKLFARANLPVSSHRIV